MYLRLAMCSYRYCALLQVKGLITVCADVSDMETVKAELSKLRPIHLLVNNAGVGQLQHFLDVTPESYDRYIIIIIRTSLVK